MVDMILAMQVACMHWIQDNNLEKEYLKFLTDYAIHRMPYSLIDFVLQYLSQNSDKVVDSPDLDKYIAELDSF